MRCRIDLRGLFFLICLFLISPMSAVNRPGMGGSEYYVRGGGDVLVPERDQVKGTSAPWLPGYNPQEAGGSWTGEGAMGGAQNSSFPVYNPASWSCSVHPRPPYPSNFPGGCQRIEPYTSDSYEAPYPQASLTSPYTSVHSPNQYFHPPPHPHYPVDHYKTCSGTAQPPNWGYPPHGTHNISRLPPYPTQEAAPPYQYRDTSSGPSQQAMLQCPQPEGWNVYEASNPYQWQQSASAQYNPTSCHHAAEGRTPWPRGDMQPTAYDVKDPSCDFNYNQRSYPNYPQKTSQPGSASKHDVPVPHYSSAPQMYNRKDPENMGSNTRAKVPNPPPAHTHLGILKINQILEIVVHLEREVDEFVGMKTDMSYRCLEESLTKQLLELDSVDTGGHDNVRQARKDAVKKLQAVLEKLERKGL